IHARALQAYRSGRTKSLAFRKEQIAQVGYLVRDHEQRIIDALKSDLGRPMLESVFFDCAAIAIEVRTAYDNVEKWTKAQRAEFNLNFFALSPKMKAEPKGVVLNITPFNVPVLMILSPLVGAIAAGNAIVTKPSEQTPAVSALLAELVPQYLDRDLYPIINGGVAETTRILELEWHHILYTAWWCVTPALVFVYESRGVTLCSFAGKNPVFVDPTYDVKTAAKRILWGRFSNAGQICLAPEYVLVPKEFQDTLVSAMKEVAESFYPEGPKKSESFSRIVSSAHAARIKRMIDETKGTVVFGGDTDVSERYIAPTVVRDVRPDDVLMGDEIFGPVLAIVPVKDVDEAIALVNAR
ncbi:Aldehyde dehydrogenase, dimeric NADP-preferring, partial [Trametes pubescens]